MYHLGDKTHRFALVSVCFRERGVRFQPGVYDNGSSQGRAAQKRNFLSIERGALHVVFRAAIPRNAPSNEKRRAGSIEWDLRHDPTPTKTDNEEEYHEDQPPAVY